MTVSRRPYKGVFPVAATIFSDAGELDLEGQRRCIDFMIDAGSDGICILANFSEQFVLTDAEREQVMTTVLDHVAGTCAGHCHHHPFQFPHMRRAVSSRAGCRGGDGHGHAALSRRDVPRRRARDLRLLRDRLGRDLDPDHDPGRAGGGYAAVGLVFGADGKRDCERKLLQDRSADGRGQVARSCRRRRRRDRRTVGTARRLSR